jgi:hypothetical protein
LGGPIRREGEGIGAVLRHGREGEVKEKRRTNQRAEGQGEGIGAVLRHGREGEKLNQCEICIMGKGFRAVLRHGREGEVRLVEKADFKFSLGIERGIQSLGISTACVLFNVSIVFVVIF